MNVTTNKQPSAQVGPAKKTAAMKAANEAKQPKKHWLQQQALAAPTKIDPPFSPERVNEAHRPQGPPPVRLLSRPEVLAVAGCTYPTLWSWMRAGTFPRSRVVGGKSMWLSTEIDAWMRALPLRKLKGDDKPLEAA
jgi:predicted DNA-binding transcriptional regulator AlpA